MSTLLELQAELAAKEKQYHKILKAIGGKQNLENEISELKKKIAEIENERNIFLSEIENAGINYDKAIELLGLKKSAATANITVEKEVTNNAETNVPKEAV